MLEKMEYVYAVYKERSFSKAAKKMFISQPALSKMVKKAEQNIGAPIFDRSTIPVSLTPEGEKYIKAVESIYQIEDNVMRYFKDLNELKIGKISLGGSSYFCSSVFPGMIRYFNNTYPNIKCDLTEGNVTELKGGLIQGNLDLVLETALKSDEKVDNIFFRTEHIVVAVPNQFKINNKLRRYVIQREQIVDHSFLKSTVLPVPLYALKDVPFIKMKPGNDMYHRSTKICADAGFEMHVNMYVDQVMTSLNIASAGLGALFVRADIVKCLPTLNNLCFYKIDHPLATRKINWAVKRGTYLSKAAKAFMTLAKYANPFEIYDVE